MATVIVSLEVTLVDIWYRSDHHQLFELAPGAYDDGTGTSNRSQWPLYVVTPPLVARSVAVWGEAVLITQGVGGAVNPPVPVHGTAGPALVLVNPRSQIFTADGKGTVKMVPTLSRTNRSTL